MSGMSDMPPGIVKPGIASGGPGELRRGDRGFALVFDAEGADVRTSRLGGPELGSSGMEDPGDAGGLARLDAEGHDVFDVEVRRVADSHAVAQAVLSHVD